MKRTPTQSEYHKLFAVLTKSDPIALTKEQLMGEIINDIETALDDGVSLKLLHLVITTKSGLAFNYLDFRRLLRISRRNDNQNDKPS